MECFHDVAQDVVAPPTGERGHFLREVGGTVRGFHSRRLGSVDGASRICFEQVAQSRRRFRRRAQDDMELRAIRAERLVPVGELSSAGRSR